MTKRYYDKHRDKLIIMSKKYAEKNPDKPKKYKRKYQLKQYNITLDDIYNGIVKNIKILRKNINLLTYAVLGIIFSLYFTMIIHTDKLAINSPTIFLMLSTFLIFSDFFIIFFIF